jgi:hypothetical protein
MMHLVKPEMPLSQWVASGGVWVCALYVVEKSLDIISCYA